MYIYSMGHYWPDTVLDNHFYSQLDIESDAQWIEDRVGIKSRRSVLSHESILDMRFGRATRQQLKDQGKIQTITDMSERSWQMARDRFPIVLDAIDTVISGTSVPDDDIPSSACTIAAQIGMERVRAFDVTSACATFVVQCHVMRGLMKSGLTREGAIFCAERYTTRLDYSDRKNCILFGDGAVAASISADPKSGSLKVIDTMVESAPSGWEHIHMPDGRTFLQNGAAVQKFAVTKTIAAAQDILARNGLAAQDAQWFIGHQANLRMLNSAMERLGVPESKHLYNVDVRGNQGAAGAPSTMSQNWEKYRKSDYIVMAVVGAGLTWGSMLLQKQ